MREDTRLRFDLVDNLSRLPYGDFREIDADKVAMAWPPTGDADPSMEAGLLAMAIAARGGTPIPSMTTKERIARDLEDGTFEFGPHPRGNVWVFHRKLRACPRCGGSGWTQELPIFEPFMAVEEFGADQLPVSDKATSAKRVKCDHRPARQPPTS